VSGTLVGGVWAQVAMTEYPFVLGIASGTPTPTGIVLWTRLVPHNPFNSDWADKILDVKWEVARDDKFTQLVRRGTTQAIPTLAHSVHVEVDGLEPDRFYFYRFMVNDAVSPIGRTRTFPLAEIDVDRLRIAFASCQRLETGGFGAYRRLMEEDVDLVLFLGDYIYDGGAWPSERFPKGLRAAGSLADYRFLYELHKREPALSQCHAALPWLTIWDDHEVFNDYAGVNLKGESSWGKTGQRNVAYQAYYEHMPMRLSSLIRGVQGLTKGGEELRIYQRAQFGKLINFHMLDCRQYRDDQACSGVGGMINPDSCEILKDTKRTMLGKEQEDWLNSNLAKQTPGEGQVWNFLVQTTMFSPRRIPWNGDYKLWNDGWDGYPAARDRLVGALQQYKVSGPVFIGGDLHENWACNVPGHDLDGNVRTIASEFVGTGITQSSYYPKGVDFIKPANKHAVYADAGRCGYGTVDISKARIEVRYRVVDNIAKSDPAISTAATFVVESGNPEIHPA